MLTLNEDQTKILEAALLELPAKNANPILQFLAKIAQESKPIEPEEA